MFLRATDYKYREARCHRTFLIKFFKKRFSKGSLRNNKINNEVLQLSVVYLWSVARKTGIAFNLLFPRVVSPY